MAFPPFYKNPETEAQFKVWWLIPSVVLDEIRKKSDVGIVRLMGLFMFRLCCVFSVSDIRLSSSTTFFACSF